MYVYLKSSAFSETLVQKRTIISRKRLLAVQEDRLTVAVREGNRRKLSFAHYTRHIQRQVGRFWVSGSH